MSSSFKKMNALGDSLTHGDISGTGVDGISWTEYMKDFAGIEICRNYGINGNRLAGEGGMADRCGEMENDADLISVFGGTNDFCLGVPVGNFEDSDIGTFCGALNTLIKKLYATYQQAEIFLITPPKIHSSLYGWETFTPNSAGFILNDYRDAILKAADRYSLPVLDLYQNAGMSCYLDTGKYRPDGLHFSNEGYKRLARKIAAFINQL